MPEQIVLPEPPRIDRSPSPLLKSEAQLREEAGQFDDDADLDDMKGPPGWKFDAELSAAAQHLNGELEPAIRDKAVEDMGVEAAEEGAVVVPSVGESVLAVVGGRVIWAKVSSEASTDGTVSLELDHGTLKVPVDVFRDDIQADLMRRLDEQSKQDTVGVSDSASPELVAAMSGRPDGEPDFDNMRTAPKPKPRATVAALGPNWKPLPPAPEKEFYQETGLDRQLSGAEVDVIKAARSEADAYTRAVQEKLDAEDRKAFDEAKDASQTVYKLGSNLSKEAKRQLGWPEE